MSLLAQVEIVIGTLLIGRLLIFLGHALAIWIGELADEDPARQPGDYFKAPVGRDKDDK